MSDKSNFLFPTSPAPSAAKPSQPAMQSRALVFGLIRTPQMKHLRSYMLLEAFLADHEAMIAMGVPQELLEALQETAEELGEQLGLARDIEVRGEEPEGEYTELVATWANDEDYADAG